MRNKKGFISISMILLILVALVILRYAYDIDILDKIYAGWNWLWERYGGYLIKFWDYILNFINR